MSDSDQVEIETTEDIGDLLEVPEDQRLDYDEPEHEDANEDEFADLSDVPEGEVVELSTATLDEDYDESELYDDDEEV